ncbi:sugar ABC transporter permease [Ruania alkalisoli]|uniref:Sugar ABC transporter permease n=1 Tax=Ruania alkalisoli TaxID=2779775 RepID=A0A7M1SV00_9MICO|nr:sugar ABC transporter permease [Ruania alkalisoli]QOR70572.1 sugar ABC transporter permease [Ruania alkalisoli]
MTLLANPGTASRARGEGAGSKRRDAAARKRRRTWLACYAFVAPSLLLGALFTFWPMVASWYYSLLDWTGFVGTQSFVGLDNYQEIVRDQYFWNALKNSFLLTVVVVPVRMLLSLIVAIVLNGKLPFSNAFRTGFFIPAITTTAIVGLVMTLILDPGLGPVNEWMRQLGITDAAVSFLGNPSLALPTLMVILIWKPFGITMVYWLAALQTIPRDVYEAAKIDGASWFQTHTRISAPLLIPFALVILVLSAASTLRVFDLVHTMTGGGPFFATETVEVFIYRNAFAVAGGGSPRIGFASAAGVVFGAVVLALAILQWWASQTRSKSRRNV